MAISISGGFDPNIYGYYLNAAFVEVPYFINPTNISNTTNGVSGLNALTLPADVSPWANSTTINLSSNCFKKWADFSSFSALTTINGSGQNPISTSTCTSFNGLVLPSNIQNILFMVCPQLNDYIRVEEQQLNFTNLMLNGCALDVDNVYNQILSVTNYVSGPYTGTPGIVNISGGTNAAPNPATAALIGYLTFDLGFTVITN